MELKTRIKILLVLLLFLGIYFYFYYFQKPKYQYKIHVIPHSLQRFKPVKKEIVFDDSDYQNIPWVGNLAYEFLDREFPPIASVPVRENIQRQRDDFEMDANDFEMDARDVQRNLEFIPQFGHDSQNVHDSLIQKTVVEKWNNLDKNVPELDSSELLSNLAGRAEKMGADPDKLRRVFNEISSRNHTISNLGDIKEMEILNTVFHNASENIKDQLVNELIDTAHMTGHGIVCPTGTISRIINSDVVEHPEKSPKTKEILRAEMLATASQVRNNMPDNYTEKDLKDALVKRYNDDYNGVVPPNEIQQELDSWINDL